MYNKLLFIIISLDDITLKYKLYYVEKGQTATRFTEDHLMVTPSPFRPTISLLHNLDFRSIQPRWINISDFISFTCYKCSFKQNIDACCLIAVLSFLGLFECVLDWRSSDSWRHMLVFLCPRRSSRTLYVSIIFQLKFLS